MLVTISGIQVKLTLKPYTADGTRKLDDPTDQLIIDYTPSDAGNLPVDDLVNQLQETSVRIKLQNHNPTLKTTEQLLRDLRAELELIRLSSP
jgi:hypothetical protein